MRRALAVVVLFTGASLGAVEVTPLWNLDFLGGQHFFEGRASSLGGNIDVGYTPVVKFSDRWSLVPTYTGSYQGTRDVQELAGGGTLFQDSTAHGLLVKSVHQWGGRWKVKPSAGARVELLRETVGEDWGDGLFDYQKYSGGIETEYALSPQSGGRLAYDYYQLAFPNYQSLESATDPTLSRELAGEKVLDSANHMVTLGWWSPLPAEGRLDLTAYMNSRAFGDQPIVKADGGLSGSDRSDTTLSVSAQSAHRFSLGETVRGLGEMSFGYGSQNSDQNHYDARKGDFLENYYNYTQWTVAPRVSAAFGSSRWVATLGAAYQAREYGDRPAQDGNGDYLSEKLKLNVFSTRLSLAYPVAKNMKLRFQSSLAWSDSNMQYEKVFRYNYRIANYMMGFSYDY